MPSPGPIAAVLFVALAGIAPIVIAPAAAQTTVAENNDTNHTIGPYYYGQSFTPTASGDHVEVSFRDANGQPAAGGRLYLFGTAFGGAPADLAGSTGSSGYLGQATAANNVYRFDPGLALTAGQQYFAYADTAQTLAYSDANPYTGGGAYGSGSATDNFADYTANHDFGFSVRVAAAGSPSAAPEPQTWLLTITGLAMVGVVLRRDAKRRIRPT